MPFCRVQIFLSRKFTRALYNYKKIHLWFLYCIDPWCEFSAYVAILRRKDSSQLMTVRYFVYRTNVYTFSFILNIAVLHFGLSRENEKVSLYYSN